MRIMQMPDALANKIAAGEVVERPASVVKELVENSIDANSTWVKIDIKEAGLQEIKVTDNGDGMIAVEIEREFIFQIIGDTKIAVRVDPKREHVDDDDDEGVIS